jgi:hypothetical protein
LRLHLLGGVEMSKKQESATCKPWSFLCGSVGSYQNDHTSPSYWIVLACRGLVETRGPKEEHAPLKQFILGIVEHRQAACRPEKPWLQSSGERDDQSWRMSVGVC